ncbi:MAG TPA: nucleotidyltransferase domain-containing protein [Chitinophagaceae bacterium]|nr:nucleotidyltransferase domain-containing protein [Chitinophagaceae bacterium]
MKNYSIALFGSTARNSFDKYSDKDILIVSDSVKELNFQKLIYESKGYSVSTYTYSKLSYLSKNKSLFIDHLILECKIFSDTLGRLKDILENHVTKTSFQKDIVKAHEFFHVLDAIPITAEGYAWFCDCFYVGVRNILILESAKNKKNTFSYLELIYDLNKLGQINKTEYKLLKDLRIVKKNYRDKLFEEWPSKEFTEQIIQVGKKLNFLKGTKFISSELFEKNAITLLRSSKYDNYSKLRLFEIYYYVKKHVNSEIEKIIYNPQMYASCFKDQLFINNLILQLPTNNKSINALVFK